jgi:hypothetical protein
VRHGVAGRSLQYVPGFFFESAGYARPDEQFSKRAERWAACCSVFDDSAPGKLQLVTDLLLRREVNPWAWVLFGWVGTLLVGSQVMKLIMEGIHLIFDDRERHSFLGRQLRGLLLLIVMKNGDRLTGEIKGLSGGVLQTKVCGRHYRCAMVAGSSTGERSAVPGQN